MAYDENYRLRALAYWDEGHTREETATVFDVSTSALQKWKYQLNKTGRSSSKKRKETWRKINPKKLHDYVEKNPDSYLKEIAAHFNCSDVAVIKALRRLKISRKKNTGISREM